MIRLIPEADAKIKKLVFENSVRSYYLSACERYAKGYVNAFITDMQILITKLGIMVESVASGPRTDISYCAKSIRYLCVTVLDNPSLLKTFEDIRLNEKGNAGKHRIARNVNIDMLRCVTAYNNLVNRIADKYGLRSLKYMVVRKDAKCTNSTDNNRHRHVVGNKQHSYSATCSMTDIVGYGWFLVIATIFLTTLFFVVGGVLGMICFKMPHWAVIVIYAVLDILLFIISIHKLVDEYCESNFIFFSFAHLICIFGLFWGGLFGNIIVHLLLMVAAGVLIILTKTIDGQVDDNIFPILSFLLIFLPFIAGWIFELYEVNLPHWAWIIGYAVIALATMIESFYMLKDMLFSKVPGILVSFSVLLCCVGVCFGGFFSHFWIHLIIYGVSSVLLLVAFKMDSKF